MKLTNNNGRKERDRQPGTSDEKKKVPTRHANEALG